MTETQTVAGTRIDLARDDDRARTWIVSDLHVDQDGDAVAAAFEAVCDLASSEDPHGSRLLILGDLFEVFVSPAQLTLGSWRRVGCAIRSAVGAGVSVTVLRGNRDFLLDDRFARRTGCRVVPGGLRFRLPDGRAAVAVHGDELCLLDEPYQRSKRWLRGRAVRWLMRVVPLRLGMRLGGAARAQSQKSGAQTAAEIAASVSAEQRMDVGNSDQERTDPEPLRYAPVREAVAEAFADSDVGGGADFLVFGHIHRTSRGWFRADGAAQAVTPGVSVPNGAHTRRPGEGEYCVLPAFDTSHTFLIADSEGVRFRNLENERVADPAPRGFPEVSAMGVD